MMRALALAFALIRLAGGFPGAAAGEKAPLRPDDFVLVKTLTAAGASGWTDTGLEVRAGEEFWFEASGTICLQTGNEEAYCGPEGIRVRTMQQPLPESNLGCLVGRVLQEVVIVEDPKTKEKTVREYGVAFPIGKAGPAVIPADGRLFLGPNENVTGDNDGAFAVRVYRRG